MKPYGSELLLDLYDCDASTFTRNSINRFLEELCDKIDMERCDLHFWDYQDEDQEEYDKAPDHLKGTSVVQFISTSTIVIHTLDVLRVVYINMFSCKEFSADLAAAFAATWFKGRVLNRSLQRRMLPK